MAYDLVKIPADGQKITMSPDGKLEVPDHPIIAYIEGDGTGSDIWNGSVKVFNTAVEKAYDRKRKIHWMEIYAGEKSWKKLDKSEDGWLPQETLDVISDYLLTIKGPMSTPTGSRIRSINMALRQGLDLYACLRPVRYYGGVPSPMKRPEEIDMVLFRENSEGIYSGIEFEKGSSEGDKLKGVLEELGALSKVRFPDSASFSIKSVSKEGTLRLVRGAVQYAIDNDRESVTLVHKGNMMDTEGSFMRWGFELAKTEFGAKELDGSPWCSLKNPGNGKTIIIKDIIANAFLQQILIRPAEYDVIATMNLNGDYISDTLAAGVGGIGIVPEAYVNYVTGTAIFGVTHGTAPKYAGRNKANPSSLILAGEMMFRHMGWLEAAEMIVKGLEGSLSSKTVTYDLARQMDGANEVSTSAFANEIISYM